MAGPRGYSSYRGKQPIGKILLAVLLILIILAAVCFMLMERYLVYDDSGKPFLDLPPFLNFSIFQETHGSGPAEPDAADIPIISVQEPAEPEKFTMQALLLPEDTKLWRERADALPLTNYDAFAATVKRPNGRLAYQSAIEDAAPAKGALSIEELSALCGEELHAIARLSSLRDKSYSMAALDEAGLKNTGGYIFYDLYADTWLDPSKVGAQTYLVRLAQECADMGFDEILLADFGFPTAGKLDKVAYPAEGKEAALRSCLTVLRTGLDRGGYEDIRLSLELPEAVVETGQDETAGLVLAELAPLVDCIYTATTPERVEALAAKVAEASETTVFVPELAGPGGDVCLVLADGG